MKGSLGEAISMFRDMAPQEENFLDMLQDIYTTNKFMKMLSLFGFM